MTLVLSLLWEPIALVSADTRVWRRDAEGNIERIREVSKIHADAFVLDCHDREVLAQVAAARPLLATDIQELMRRAVARS
jgi:hypothetical protein